MINLQDFILNNELFKQYKVDDLLFVEYKCIVEEGKIGVWWHDNFFSYVLSGEMVWRTPQREYIARAGDCFFAKKGSIIAGVNYRGDYCELLVFVPDNFIKTVIEKYNLSLAGLSPEKNDTIIPLVPEDALVSYFHSLLSYFPQNIPPPEALLKLKFEELILNLLTNNKNVVLKCYFKELCTCNKTSIKAVMEANFSSNLSMKEFAKLCFRSLSSFKREFFELFKTSPGKWLLEKRLEYSRYLLETTNDPVEDIAFNSGFENRSHFIRVFRNRYGETPGKYQAIRSDSRKMVISF